MKKILFTLACALGMWGLNAQRLVTEVVAPSGGSIANATTVLDWTLGEVAVTTLNSGNQQVTQGFHQLTVETTSTRELPRDIGRIAVFPNPTADILRLSLEFDRPRSVDIRFIDIHGRTVWEEHQSGSSLKSTRQVAHLPAGTYFLNVVIDDRAYTQTFKVQKIK